MHPWCIAGIVAGFLVLLVVALVIWFIVVPNSLFIDDNGLGNLHIIIFWAAAHRVPLYKLNECSTAKSNNGTVANTKWCEINSALYEKLRRDMPLNIRMQFAHVSSFQLVNYFRVHRMWPEVPFVSLGFTNAKRYFEFWKTVRPTIRDAMTSVLRERGHLRGVNPSPVVFHFRCSDSPMNRLDPYYLNTKKGIMWGIQMLRARNILPATGGKILILSCTSWGSKNQESARVCDHIRDTYRKIFFDAGITSIVHCGSIIEDYVTMMRSPAVLTSGSSFAFSATLAGNGLYVELSPGQSMGNGVWNLQDIDTQQAARDTDSYILLSPHRPILHEDVKDYHDLQTLRKLIMQN